MDRLNEGIALGFILGILHGLMQPGHSVPVVPNFTQGSLTSKTETTSVVTEVINSMDYNTGYQYSVTGTNIKNTGNSIAPSTTSGNSNTLNGVTSTWTTLDAANKPSWSIVDNTKGFQFTETLQAPGLANHTIINRTTEIRSVTESTSIFSQ
jgi:hypothetical protein